MKKLNWIFTLSSISLIFVSLERFSPTTQILLQPYNFLRFHELLQMTMLILFTVIVSVLLLKEVTNNFAAVQKKYGFLLLVIFIIGTYFYATGNGVHEVSSFNFNNFCDTKTIFNDVCGSFFINNYYVGNILFFLGATLASISLLTFEKYNSSSIFNKNDIAILATNALIYSLAIIAYAGFDRVNVGFFYAATMTVIAVGFFWSVRKNYNKYPLITYTTIGYFVGLVFAFYFKFI